MLIFHNTTRGELRATSQRQCTGSMYTLRDVPGKGNGLVAARDIPKGSRILEETPIITTPIYQRDDESLKGHIFQQVNSLNEHQRQLFLSLHNLYPYQDIAEQSLGILRTVALPVEADGVEGGIFLEACRINHACDNNAQKNWNQNIKRHTVHALKDIRKGEEITIRYLGIDSSRDVRQRRLQDKFRFLCSCRLCSLPTEQSQESDMRIERINQLDHLIGSEGMRMNFSLRTLRLVEEQVRLYNEQGPGDIGLPRAYLDAAQVVVSNGDLARGRVFLERAVQGWQTALGSDSKEVIEYSSLARNPAELPMYGLSMKWKTSLDESPQGFNSNAIEDWLWRRERSEITGLRNREVFPGFTGLPSSKPMDLDFYEEANGDYQPLHHWCFLGEIVSHTTLHHLELELTDVDNETIPLHFYTKGLGSELAPSQIRKGYTIVVLYAQRYVFIHGDPGIRQENPQLFKVRFTIPCKQALILSN
jgi:hypothetical protein